MDILLEAELIKEIQYLEWLSNVVVVPKKNDKWRVCVDYTNLNDACLKDTFPLPWIDQIVDATAGHDLFSFLDAYLGYNQILMYPSDEEKTDFITPIQHVLLQGNAVWIKERRGHLSVHDVLGFLTSSRKNNGGLYQ